MALFAAWISLLGIGAAPASAGPMEPVRYRPPVSAAVIDPFRLPPEPWMAGNRGLEYATSPGSTVTAIGAGRVAFAGMVARRSVVTVNHPDGLRSSYVGLTSTSVAVGDAVSGGDVVGIAAERLHLGVRRGAVYLDPASLWTHDRPGRVILVPLDGESPASRPGRQPLADLSRGGWWGSWPALGAGDTVHRRGDLAPG